MTDDLYVEKMRDLEEWRDWNDSDAGLSSRIHRDIFFLRKLRGFVAALVEYVGYQQALEGRIPGDKDEKSTFPFPDSLADRRRLGTGPSLIVPVVQRVPEIIVTPRIR